MKRAHRRSHLIIWTILGPVMFAIIILAVFARLDEPVNDVVPGVLFEEAS